MIGMFVVAIVLAAADAGQPAMPAHVQPVVMVDARPNVSIVMPDTASRDGDTPSRAWLAKMVRPCAKSGDRMVC